MYLVILMKKAKKENSNSSKNTIMSGNELKSLIILVVIVSLIFAAFYGITLLLDKKVPQEEETITQETIQYDEIMIGQLLNRNEKEYYVLIKKENNHYNNLYVSYLNNYIKDIKYYTVDLSNALNSTYIGDVTNIEKNDFFNSKFADTTLIKVKNKKVNAVYSTYDEIITLLEKLAA